MECLVNWIALWAPRSRDVSLRCGFTCCARRQQTRPQSPFISHRRLGVIAIRCVAVASPGRAGGGFLRGGGAPSVDTRIGTPRCTISQTTGPEPPEQNNVHSPRALPVEGDFTFAVALEKCAALHNSSCPSKISYNQFELQMSEIIKTITVNIKQKTFIKCLVEGSRCQRILILAISATNQFIHAGYVCQAVARRDSTEWSERNATKLLFMCTCTVTSTLYSLYTKLVCRDIVHKDTIVQITIHSIRTQEIHMVNSRACAYITKSFRELSGLHIVFNSDFGTN